MTQATPISAVNSHAGDQHPIEKQGVEQCVVLHVESSYTEVVLNGISAFPERFNPPCHCAIWQRSITTCFKQSLKTFLCTTTSCHFNFDPGMLLQFCKHGLRGLALSLRKSTFYTLQQIDNRTVTAVLVALTHLIVLVHVHKADSSRTHHRHVTAVLPVLFIKSFSKAKNRKLFLLLNTPDPSLSSLILVTKQNYKSY